MSRVAALLLASVCANAVLGVMVIDRARRSKAAREDDRAARRHEQVEDFGRSPSTPGATVFLGDSLTAGGPWCELIGACLNRGIPGDTVEGVHARLVEVLDRRPGRVFLMIGINDLLRGSSPGRVALGVRGVVEEALQSGGGMRLHLLSLLPIDESRFPAQTSNADIRATNAMIRRVAEETGAVYIDLHTAFAAGDGGLRPELTRDGLHLTMDGYLLWRDLIQSSLR